MSALANSFVKLDYPARGNDWCDVERPIQSVINTSNVVLGRLDRGDGGVEELPGADDAWRRRRKRQRVVMSINMYRWTYLLEAFQRSFSSPSSSPS